MRTKSHTIASTTLPQAIRYHRERMHLTQEAAAERSGIRTATWCQLESGMANPRLSTLDAVAFTLGVPVNDLFTKYSVGRNLIDDTNNSES